MTGVDLSEVAVEQARALASQLRLDARFICADVLDLPTSLTASFDIVYTSRGVLHWLPDLPRWAEGIARTLRQGGFFYLLEGHPVASTLDDESTTLRVRYPYFSRPAAQRYRVVGSYADRDLRFKETFQYEWPHSLGEVITSLADAGPHIEFVHEFPFAFWEQVPWLVQRDGEWWLPKRMQGELPLSF